MKDAASRQEMAEERYPTQPLPQRHLDNRRLIEILNAVALRERTAYIAALELCAQREAKLVAALQAFVDEARFAEKVAEDLGHWKQATLTAEQLLNTL